MIKEKMSLVTHNKLFTQDFTMYKPSETEEAGTNKLKTCLSLLSLPFRLLALAFCLLRVKFAAFFLQFAAFFDRERTRGARYP